MEKIWKIKQAEEASVQRLKDELKVHETLCRLLIQRGIPDFESARYFFRPDIKKLHNPFLMKGMERAVQRIVKAISSGEKIMVYGDYDVDGTTSVAVVYSFLKKNFSQLAGLLYYIPHRYREGYGISTQGIDEAARQGISLIIALDCGIKSIEKTMYAGEKGIDLIICDHHLPGPDLPAALAILNPKQEGCRYPYKELSGCGIGYKLISAIAIAEKLDPETVERYLDLVATSIAADIVPIDGENRILAFHGLYRANTTPCLALKTIKEIAALKKAFTISDLVFIVAPRINAAGRMDDARKAVALFVEENPERAKELAMALHSDNSDRKTTDKTITEEALEILKEEEQVSLRKATVLFRPHWHKGVVGIVASRLIEHYYRPTIVLTESEGKITGSARSVAGFNIYEAIRECSDLLENFGGHFFAAGLTLLPEHLEAFREKFEKTVAHTISEDSLHPVLEIDAVLRLKDINPVFYKILKQFEPFGPANLRPVFLSRGVRNKDNYCKIVKDQHIRFWVCQEEDCAMSGIGFGLANRFGIIDSGRPFDIVYTIDENEWNGKVSLQLKVIDIRES